MMLLPVVYSSLSLTKPNSSDDQMISSSAMRETCIMQIAAAAWNSNR